MKTKHLFLASAATVLAVSVVVSPASAAQSFFTDVKESMAVYPEVKSLFDSGKIDGYKDGTFRPYESVTRAQAAKMIAGILALDTSSVTDPGFKDVPKSKWYYGAVAALAEQKVMGGFADNTFRPDQTLTRAEASKLIAEAFDLKAGEEQVSFKDVSEKKWYHSYVQALVQNKVTLGKTADLFTPDANVTRGELVAFAGRANAVESAELVEEVKDGQVVISGKTYTATESLKGLLTAANAKALQGAEVVFTQKEGVIQTIESLQLKANGTEAAPLVLDGNGAVMSGNITVDGDAYELKNITINGDLTVTEKLTTSFSTDKLTVKGKTIFASDENIIKAAAAENPKTRIKITFKDSTVAVIEIGKTDAYFSATGSTKVEYISLTANASIFADPDVIIPKVDIFKGVTQIELNATIQSVVIDSNDEIEVSGKGNFDNVVVNTDKKVSLATTGTIKNLDVKNDQAVLNVKETAKITNVTVPPGKDVSKTIENYEQVKENVQNVGGVKNPDAPAPSPVYTPPTSGGGQEPLPPVSIDPDPSPNPAPSPDEQMDYFAAGLLEVEGKFGYITLNIKNADGKKVYYQQVDGYGFTPPKEGETLPAEAVEYKGQELINWFDSEFVIYRVDSQNKLLDVVEPEERWYNGLLDYQFNDDGTMTIRTLVKPNDQSADDYYKYLYIYQDGKALKLTDFSDVVWNSNSDIPEAVMNIDGIAKEKYSRLFFSINGYSHYTTFGEWDDSKNVEILALYDLAKETDQNLHGYEFEAMLSDITGKFVEREDAQGNPYGEWVRIIESDSLSIQTYKDRILAKELSEWNQATVKSMVESVNADLKEKVDALKEAREKVDSLFKEDRSDYEYEESFRDDLTEADVQAAKQAVDAVTDEMREKTYLISQVEEVEWFLQKEEVTAYINNIELTVPGQAEAGAVINLLEAAPEGLHFRPYSAGMRVVNRDDYDHVENGSSYLEIAEEQLKLIRPNTTGTAKTEYVQGSFEFNGRSIQNAILPISILSADRSEDGLSNEVSFYGNYDAHVVEGTSEDTLISYRGVTVEQLTSNLFARDYSSQSYEIRNGQGVVKTTGLLASGDTVTVTAENGTAQKTYIIELTWLLTDIQKGSPGTFTFRTKGTTEEELRQSLTVKKGFNENMAFTLSQTGEDQYKIVIEDAGINQLYSVYANEREIRRVKWASYEMDQLEARSLKITETDLMDIESAEDIQIGFAESLDSPTLQDTATVDGVTIHSAIEEQSDGTFRVNFTSSGIDGGAIDEERSFYASISINNVETRNIFVSVNEEGIVNISLIEV